MTNESICDGSGMILDYGGPFDCPGCPACLEVELGVAERMQHNPTVTIQIANGEPMVPALPLCLCPATSEYDPPCPRHGILGIGVTGR